MRFVLIAVATLTLSGCSEEATERIPTAPSLPVEPVPQPPSPEASPRRTFVWVVVISEFGGCVPSATVEIVRGQGLGRKVTQADDCSYWDPDYNAVFNDLMEGQELTLRASAPGYTAAEMTVVPTSGPQKAFAFELSRIR
jgi:hypothetical protein